MPGRTVRYETSFEVDLARLAAGISSPDDVLDTTVLELASRPVLPPCGCIVISSCNKSWLLVYELLDHVVALIALLPLHRTREIGAPQVLAADTTR